MHCCVNFASRASLLGLYNNNNNYVIQSQAIVIASTKAHLYTIFSQCVSRLFLKESIVFASATFFGSVFHCRAVR